MQQALLGVCGSNLRGMEGIVFIRRVYGNWIVISICILYELCAISDILETGKPYCTTGAIHILGTLIMAILFKFTKDDNEIANKYGYYLFAVILITSWFAYN